jgi:hypothetical protein
MTSYRFEPSRTVRISRLYSYKFHSFLLLWPLSRKKIEWIKLPHMLQINVWLCKKRFEYRTRITRILCAKKIHSINHYSFFYSFSIQSACFPSLSSISNNCVGLINNGFLGFIYWLEYFIALKNFALEYERAKNIYSDFFFYLSTCLTDCLRYIISVS